MIEASEAADMGEERVSLFLSGLPLWAAAILLVVAPTVAAMFGLVLMRRRVGLERLTSNNEIAGFKSATVCVIYAVLLAFAVIVVWEKFRDAETADAPRGRSVRNTLPACCGDGARSSCHTRSPEQLP